METAKYVVKLFHDLVAPSFQFLKPKSVTVFQG